jgi:hypothetical protein
MSPGVQRGPAAPVLPWAPAGLAAPVAVAFAFGEADGEADGEATLGRTRSAAVAADPDARAGGRTAVVHAFPYAAGGRDDRDSLAAVDARAAAVWLAAGLGPPLPNTHAASIMTPSPPPRMMNRRRQ